MIDHTGTDLWCHLHERKQRAVPSAKNDVLPPLDMTREPEAKRPGKRGPKPKPVIEFPQAAPGPWIDPPDFPEALLLHMRRHGDSSGHLEKALAGPSHRTDCKTIRDWTGGIKTPSSVQSLAVLGKIERRYCLEPGYFKAKLPPNGRAAGGHHRLQGITSAERRRLAWHLPADFDRRPKSERDAILHWIKTTIVAGSTDYRQFQREAAQHRFSLRFPGLVGQKPQRRSAAPTGLASLEIDSDDGLAGSTRDAPPHLQEEIAGLIAFKTSTLTPVGVQRHGIWGEETASQKLDHLGLMFGALCAPGDGPIKGQNIPAEKLSLAMLLFPAVWDWYLQWREERRGFFTSWEANMLDMALAMARVDTGWLRQNPDLRSALAPIEGLVSVADVDAAMGDWNAVCDRFCRYAAARKKEIQRVARIHRDPFEPILPVLEADSPVAEYRKITEEIVRSIPDARRHPKASAEAVRSFLMLRLGLHLGVRQKNLRQLRFCRRGCRPLPEKQLETMKCGELRWSERNGGWEALIPAAAFKNASSSFFSKKPFRLCLPNLADLYEYIDAYLDRHRQVLLGGADDPGTFFVKTAKQTTKNAAYDQNSFYEAWRLIIQRYGIYNPYTGRGAIEGLLPHGPHNVRDVLATHVLKKTGSYEQAGYAIQDTAEIVAKHYGRFLPQDKSALAAEVLNRAWDD